MRQRRTNNREIVAWKIYTVPELARILRIGPGTVYNRLSRGDDLPKFFRVGRKVRFEGKAIQDFINSQYEK
jgi:predicted DNA-binding transcriptional regulator AlpA